MREVAVRGATRSGERHAEKQGQEGRRWKQHTTRRDDEGEQRPTAPTLQARKLNRDRSPPGHDLRASPLPVCVCVCVCVCVWWGGLVGRRRHAARAGAGAASCKGGPGPGEAPLGQHNTQGPGGLSLSGRPNWGPCLAFFHSSMPLTLPFRFCFHSFHASDSSISGP